MLDAFALGARHGLDADHLAAISELTASERGGLREGCRNHTLNRAAFALGQLVAAGHPGVRP